MQHQAVVNMWTFLTDNIQWQKDEIILLTSKSTSLIVLFF